MIKAVIFDCFEVLFLHASEYFFRKYVGQDADKHEKFLAVNAASDRGELTYAERIQGIADAIESDYDFVSKTIYKDLVRNEQLFEYIHVLKNKYKIGLLSNTGQGSAEQFISKQEINSIFDDAVFSYQVGYVKPQKEIFELAAERLGLNLGECVFVDDSLKNCQAAEAAGMHAIHYITFEEFVTKLEKML